MGKFFKEYMEYPAAQDLRKTELLEALAELEHEQWTKWSMNIADSEEHLEPGRIKRWQSLWVPYRDLPESEKELDREWAEQVLWIVKKHMGIK